MKDLDPVAREFERVERFGVAGFYRRIDFLGGNPQAGGIEIETVELARRLDQRKVAPRGHVVDDGRVAASISADYLALGREKARESFGEIGAAAVETNGHNGFPAGGRIGGPLLNGAATNRRQPLLY